jgi:hypothetical protein
VKFVYDQVKNRVFRSIIKENQLEIKSIIKNLKKPSEDILIFARFADIILIYLESRSISDRCSKEMGYI